MANRFEKYVQPAAGAQPASPNNRFAKYLNPEQPQPDDGGGFFSALAGGAKSTLGALRNTFNIYTGDSADVLDQATAVAQRTPDQEAFAQEIKRRAGEQDEGWLNAVKAVVGAAWQQPVGALHEMAAQLPNMGVALGGFGAGATVGSVIGGPIGAITGGILGMFAGNAALETGFRGGELATDGTLTPEEMAQARAQGAIKGGVITGVDVATLGLSRAFAGAPGRAVERAITDVLTKRGVDITSEAATKTALRTPEVLSEAVTAGAGALARTMSSAQRLSRGGVQFTLESVGEGAGEYLGSTAAGLEASPSDAVLEALMSIPMSAAEMAIAGSGIEKGQLTQQAEGALGREINVRDVVNRVAGAPTVDSAIREAARMTGTDPRDVPVPFNNIDMRGIDQPEPRIPGIEIPGVDPGKVTADDGIPVLTDVVDTKGFDVERPDETLPGAAQIPTLTDTVNMTGRTAVREDQIPTLTDAVDPAVREQLNAAIDQQAQQAATSPQNDLPEPTEAQKAAGNYTKGHVRLHGLDITVENPRGSTRSGTSPDGSKWENTMQHHYGYIRRTEGADGEQVDTFIGPAPDSQQVFVVDQINRDGTFDEHKALIGFESQEAAVEGYKSNYQQDWKVGPVTAMTMDQFRGWLAQGKNTEPLNAEFFAQQPPAMAEAEEITPEVVTDADYKASDQDLDAEFEAAMTAVEAEQATPATVVDATDQFADRQREVLQEQAQEAYAAEEAEHSDQYGNYEQWIADASTDTLKSSPGLVDQINMDTRLNDGEAEVLVAAIKEKISAEMQKKVTAEVDAAYKAVEEWEQRREAEEAADVTTTTPTPEPASDSTSTTTTKPAGKSSKLPKIITANREKYIQQLVKAQKLKKDAPGYADALAKIEAQYETDLDKAYASLTFEQYNELNSDVPEALNRQAWDALRAEHGGGTAPAAEEAPTTSTSDAAARWDAMDYSQRQAIASAVHSNRKVVHRISGSKWAQLGLGEQKDMEAQMAKAAPAETTAPREHTEADLLKFSEQILSAIMADSAVRDAITTAWATATPEQKQQVLAEVLNEAAIDADTAQDAELAAYARARAADLEYLRSLVGQIENILFKPPGPTWTAAVVHGALHAEAVADPAVVEATRKGPAPHRAALTDRLMTGIETGLKSTDAGEKAAFAQLLVNGELDPALFGPQYFDGAYKESMRIAEKADRQARREAWKTQSDEALKNLEAEFSADPAAFTAFLVGWNHALEGNSASNLPTSNVPDSQIAHLKDGYNRGFAFVQENGGVPGKPRQQKMDRTGVILRRVQDSNKFNRDAEGRDAEQEITRAIEKMLDSVSRAEAFPLLPGEGATPGTTRALEFVRDQFPTPRGFLENWLYRTHGLLFWRGATTTEQLVRFAKFGSKATSYWRDDEPVTGWAERVDAIADQLGVYTQQAMEEASIYEGVKSVQDVATRAAKRKTPGLAEDQVSNEFIYRKIIYRYQQDEAKETAQGDTKQMRRPRFDRVMREGLKDHRGGRNITLDELKKTFGFGDIHPGNYVTAQQLQDHSNYAYDAFMDMADLLGWKPEQIGFGGRLHLAFGALGRGRHAAHYQDVQPVFDANNQPTGQHVAVINLTNTKGDGTVAHEYFHAIDFMVRRGNKTGSNMPATTRKAVALLRNQMKSDDAIAQFANNFLFGGWTWQRNKSMGKVKSALWGLHRMEEALAALEVGSRSGDLQYVAAPTAYHSNAMDMGKDYWGNDEEMLARAGEAWVYDQLQAKQADDTYLVSDWVKAGKVTKQAGYKGTPYPNEEERAYINGIISLFVKHLTFDDAGLPVLDKEFSQAIRAEIIDPARAAIKRVMDSLPKDDAELAAMEQAKRDAAQKAREEAAALEAQKLREQLAEQSAGLPEALEGATTEDLEAAFEAAMDAVEAEQQETLPGDNRSGSTKLVDAILARGFGSPMDWRELFRLADAAFGGTQAAGIYTPKDAYDALEVALNREILRGDYIGLNGAETLDRLEALINNLPTQSKRTEEQDEFQQFSTPPTIAYLMARASGIDETDMDILLEPSAGTGNLATVAVKTQQLLRGLILNEYSARRAALLEGLPFGVPASTYREDAAHLNDILPGTERPTVVIMNPPFSADAGKNKGKRDNAVGMNHLEAALARLEPGGRLVALVGQGLAQNLPQASGFWKSIKGRYTVRANIGLSGESYRKFGTTFDNQLLVIDKTGPQPAAVTTITDDFKGPDALSNLKQALTRLSEVIDARVYPGEQFTDESGREKRAGLGSHARLPVSAAAGGEGAGAAGKPAANGNDAGRGTRDDAGTGDGARGKRGKSGSGSAGGSGTSADPAAGGSAGRTLTDILGDAAGTAFAGSEEALKGLFELFGGSSLRTFPGGLDPETYAKAKPHFQKAWANYKQTGKSIQEFFMELARLFGVAITRAMKPYAMHFVKEMQGGGEPAALVDKSDPALPVDVEPEAFGELTNRKAVADKQELTDSVFDTYHPEVTLPEAIAHPGTLVESAAMAAVHGPPTNYVPKLPRKAVLEGALSDAQIEQVIRAGAAHERMLPDGTRMGYFMGDGTGLGKAREIIGVMLDNMANGRKRHVWVSKDAKKLYRQALKDWKAVTGQDAGKLIRTLPSDADTNIDLGEGIIFLSYDQLRSDSGGKGKKKAAAEGKAAEQKQKRSRLEQLKQWMGADFDGVIAFDESHKMAKSATVKGARGDLQMSQTATAGMGLQDAAPNSRVLYVSATGATEVSNFGYLKRLGLWGAQTAFGSVADFINKVGSKGVSMMELVAQNMKSMGVYLARSLSYHDVTYDTLTHNLTEDQTVMYNTIAEAWQNVLRNINEALIATGAMNEDGKAVKGNKAKQNAMSAFWGAQQRFFNQTLTSLQMPSLIKDIEARMAEKTPGADDGDAIVLQLVNTNEAATERAAADAAAKGIALDDLDLTPRQTIMQFVESSFPIHLYEQVSDEEGKVTSQLVLDSQGKPVVSQEALRMRTELLERLADMPFPDGALDQIINHFGPEAVAEVTGRQRRLIEGRKGNEWQRRSPKAVEADIADFQGDKKRILVFSAAGGTGVDFHADLRVKNQRKRIHYLVQPGWRADEAVQGFGRTHRSNQKQAPHYVLVTTNLKGHLRFMSSVARRLDQLGALTKGQRETGSQGIFSAEHNLENTYATEALTGLISDIESKPGAVPDGFTISLLENGMGLNLRDNEGRVSKSKVPSIPQFLNRILALPVTQQNFVFETFFNRLQQVIDYHREQGDYDSGIENIKGISTLLIDEQQVYKHPVTGATTSYVKLQVETPIQLTTFSEFLDIAEQRGKLSQAFYARNRASGRIYAFLPVQDKTTKEGKVVPQLRRYGPSNSSSIERRDVVYHQYPDGEVRLQDRYEKLTPQEAAKAWQEEFDSLPKTVKSDVHLITGAILPIYDRLPNKSVKVVRAQTDDGRRLIGLRLWQEDVTETLRKLGADAAFKETPQQLLEGVLRDNKRIKLANGWAMARVMVSGEHRVELKIGSDGYSWGQKLLDYGVIGERINYQMRYFLPTAKPDVLAKILKQSPVVDILNSADDGPLLKVGDDKPGRGMSKAMVSAAVSSIVQSWKSGPQVIVIGSTNELPDRLRAYAYQEAGGNVNGVYDPSGRVYLIAENLRSVEQVRKTLAHEAIGHYAFMREYQDDLADIFSQVLALGETDEAIGKIVAKVRKEYAGQDDAVIAAETVAAVAEGGIKGGILLKIRAMVIRWLRKLGFNIDFTADELHGLLRAAADSLRRFSPKPAATRFPSLNAVSEDKPTFYSAALRAAIALKQERGTPEQMLNSLRKAPGVKAAELDWLGVEEFAKGLGGTVTKQQLVDFIAANGVQVRDVVLAGNDSLPPLPDGWVVEATDDGYEVLDEDGESRGEGATERDAIESAIDPDELADRPDAAGRVKFSSYQLPGGANYREVLLTLPVDRLAYAKSLVDPAVWERMTDEQRAQFTNKPIRGDGKTTFRSVHWDTPNVLAHIRLNDRTDARGRKILFVEEIQSDWHQQGRDKGYRARGTASASVVDAGKRAELVRSVRELLALHYLFGFDSLPAAMAALIDHSDWRSRWGDGISNDDAYVLDEYRRLIIEERNAVASVPDAPFKNNAWVELAIKKVLRMAAEGGYEGVAWTTGKQQAARYDLSKVVDVVTVQKVGDVYDIALLKNRRGSTSLADILYQESGLDIAGVAQHVGKELAQKIEKQTRRHEEYRGNDLRVGGEGMITFYDKVLPNLFKMVARKLDKDVAISSIELSAQTGSVNSMDITPAMRDGALRGQPLFSRAPQTDSAAFRRWFGNSKVVDNDGNPLVVFHGTSADFWEFRTPAYFVASEREARAFGEEKDEGDVATIPVYLSIQNPLELDDFGDFAEWDQSDVDKAEKNGYDGVVLRPASRGEPAMFIAFRPSQIKSAWYNKGTFDPSNPNILFSRVTAPSESDYAQENASIREEDKSLWDRIKQEAKRQLTPAGLLPDSVFHAKIARDAKLQVVEFSIAHLIGELERAIRADYKVRAAELSDADMAVLADALTGKMPPSLGEKTREAIIAMRQHIDAQSEQYVQILQEQTGAMLADMDAGERGLVQAFLDAGEIEAASDSRADRAAATAQRNVLIDAAREDAKALWGDGKKMQSALARAAAVAEKVRLMQTIAANVGTYAHRSYQAFDDPNWYRKVPDRVIDDARAYLMGRMMESSDMSEEAAQDRARVLIEDILKEGTAYDSLEAFVKESKLGAKDLSVLIRRKRIAPEIRALLGEYRDPRINFAKSATKMARLIWNQRFLDRVRETGLGVFLFEEDDRPPNTTKIAAEGSEVYAPLNGLYAPREIVQAFKDALGKERLEGMYKWMVQANGAVKFGKTVLSPTTTLRNWQSAMLFTLANGHFDLTQMRKSVDGLREYFTHSGQGEKLAYLRKLKDLGVVYDTAYAGEMMKLLDDFQSDTLIGFGPDSVLRKSIDFAKKAYSYGDDFWKIIGFENEKNMLMKHAGMTEAAAEIEAAERIRNTYPTYSMVGLGIQKLRRFPLVGTFVSFPAEIIRTSFNMLGYIAKDLKTPGMRPLALRRIAGLSIAAAFAHVLQGLFKQMFDVDDDDEEAVRLQAAPWQQNSNLLFLGRDDAGNMRYIDISFLDPYNYWKRPINAMLRDQPWQEEAVSAAQEILTPFFGTDILAGTLLEVIANKKDTGGEVYKPTEPLSMQLMDIANHLRKDLQPGLMSNLERTWRAMDGQLNPQGQRYDMGDELAAWMGWRATTLDTKVALRYHTFDFKDAKADASSALNQVLTNPNEVDAEQIVDAYEMAMAMREQAYEDMIKMVGAAERSGLTPAEVRLVLRANDISQQDIAAILTGRIPDWVPSRQSETGAVREAMALLGPDKAQEIRQRYRQARQEAIRRRRESSGGRE